VVESKLCGLSKFIQADLLSLEQEKLSAKDRAELAEFKSPLKKKVDGTKR
jgi:hypothetical protein